MSDNSNYLHGRSASTELAINEFSDDRHASYEHLKHGHSGTSGYTELKHTCIKCDQGIVTTNQNDNVFTLISEVTDWSGSKNDTKEGKNKFANENRVSFLNTHANKYDADNNVYIELQEAVCGDTEARRSNNFSGRLSRFDGYLSPIYTTEQSATTQGQHTETNAFDSHEYAEIAPTQTENATNNEETKQSCKKRLLWFIVFGILLFVAATTITLVLTVFKQELDYNTSCPVEDSNTACKTSAASCISGRCFCPSTMYYISPDDQCLDLVDIDGTCTMTDSDLECKTSAAMCTDNKCKCPVAMYHDTTDESCLSKLAYNTTCPIEDSNTACKTSAASCIGGRCLCPSTMYYLSPDDQCLDLADLNGICTMTDSDLECKTSSAVCRDQTCQCSMTMYHDITEDACLLIDCGTPPDLTNGNIVSNGDTKYEDTATVTCDEGHTLVPDKPTLTCQTHGTWGDLPQCEAIACVTFNFPDNSIDTSDDSSGKIQGKVFGETIELTCESGYVLIGGTTTQNCGTDGQWDATTCESSSATCTPFPVIANSVFSDVSDSSITVSCNEGYTLSGNKVIPCDGTSGSWSDSPSCTIVDCGSFGVVINGETIGTSTTYESTITINCDTGYKPTSPSTVSCLASGDWSNQTTCAIKDCSEYTVPEHATVTNGDSGTQYGTVLTITCDEGYATSDATTVTCTDTEEWSSTPVCMIVDCGDAVVENGHAIGVDIKTTYNENVVFECDIGYTMTGTSSINCEANGEWSTFPQCQIVTCGEVDVLDNGSVVSTSGTSFGDVATLECNTGYILTGKIQISCLETADWDTLPTCIEVTCGNLDPASHGTFVSTEDSKVFILTCEDGYEIPMESNTITCNDNGTWSEVGTCDPVECITLSQPDHGQLSTMDTGQVYEDEITITCDTGYIIEETDHQEIVSRCQADKSWSYSASCVPINCPEHTVPDFANIESGEENTEFGTSITILCSEGYESSDPLEVTCQADETWSPSPTCIIKNCLPFTTPDNSAIVNGEGNTEYNSEITVACNDGYDSDDSLLVICQADKTWSASPRCAIRYCPTFTVPDNAKIESGQGNIEFDSEITVACIEEYETEDVLVVTCQANKTWSASPMCNIKNCPTFIAPDNANIVDGEGNTEYNSEITVACNDGYDSYDSLLVICQADKTWSPSPACTIKNCPTFTLPDNANIVDGEGNTDYNSEITVACNDGYDSDDSLLVKCQANSTWSPSPRCAIRFCPTFTVPDNAVIESGQGNIEFDSGITVACIEGYATQDVLAVTCQVDKTWSASPSCSVIQCAAYVPPDNAFITSGDGNTDFGETITVSCTDGYETNDAAVVECRLNETWSDSPMCSIVECGTYEITNGIVGSIETTYGSNVTLTCHNGYFLQGNFLITCLATGLWDDSPNCTVVDCGELPNDANGEWMYTGTNYNDTASITCNVGRQLVDNPDANLFCSEDGTWVGTLFCVPNDCGDLTLVNGDINYLNGTTTYLSMVHISCDSGFHVFNGEDTATCEDQGFWSTEPGCTNVGTVSVGSPCYSFIEAQTRQITCDIAVDGWGTSGIFAVSDDGQFNLIIQVTQSGGIYDNQSMLQHISLHPNTVLSADSASLVVDFSPVSATDAGQYVCGAVVGTFETAGQNNTNIDSFIIFIQGNPMLVIDNTVLQNNTQAVVQCTFESDTDNSQSLQIQIKYKDENTFVDISEQSATSESEPQCYKIYTVSTTFIATDAHHEAEVKCAATLTDQLN